MRHWDTVMYETEIPTPVELIFWELEAKISRETE